MIHIRFYGTSFIRYRIIPLSIKIAREKAKFYKNKRICINTLQIPDI